LVHSILVNVPVSVIGWLASNSAANEWCASPVAVLERWQIAYLPVYSVWAALVVVMFPPVFGYR